MSDELIPESLAAFLREVSNWSWEDFCTAEHDDQYTTNQSVIFALVRSCAMEKLDAIKVALNRLDGKLKTPVKIEYPKIYFLYPHAKNSKHKKPETIADIRRDIELYNATEHEPPEPEQVDLPSLTLRQTLAKMADSPRQVPEAVIAYATQTQQHMQHPDQIQRPPTVPLVKSVVAAHLLKMAQNRNINALTEVFDQIDGKLVETIQILGEDIFIVSYSIEAPEGAYLNENGVLQLEAAQAQDVWAEKLGKQNDIN